MTTFKEIFQLPFAKAIADAGGELFVVGGCVRDALLDKEPKDIDLIVRLLPFQELSDLLGRFGRVDLVGESFGVIKFKTNGQEFDIALPRTDTKVDGATGHKSIEVQSDHRQTIDSDLFRRDFTINAMAVDATGQIIDPWDGLTDLRLDQLRCVSKVAFVEDPLRMVRAVQFAARFDMNIEDDTFMMIKENAGLITEITPERVLIEFQKVFDKGGNVGLFASLLHRTGLFKAFFDRDIQTTRLDVCESISEFLFFSVADAELDVPQFFRDKLKVDNDTLSDLKAFQTINKKMDKTLFHLMFQAIKQSPIVLKSGFIPEGLKKPFTSGLFPKTVTELALTGEDFLSMGMKGKEVGEAISTCLDAIFLWQCTNSRESLLHLFDVSQKIK